MRKHSKQEPDLMSRHVDVDKHRHVYRVEFDLTATRQTTYVDMIQILFTQMCVHDNKCAIKAFFHLSPANDITSDQKICEQ